MPEGRLKWLLLRGASLRNPVKGSWAGMADSCKLEAGVAIWRHVQACLAPPSTPTMQQV